MPRFYTRNQPALDFGYSPIDTKAPKTAPRPKPKEEKVETDKVTAEDDIDAKAMEPVRKTEAGKYDGLETQEQLDWWNNAGEWQ